MTRGRLRGVEGLGGFAAAAGQMDKRPRHGEDGDPVALGGDQQLLKSCLRMTPPKADQDTTRGIEDAAALGVERDLVWNPVCRHVFPICCEDPPMREMPSPDQHPWRPLNIPALHCFLAWVGHKRALHHLCQTGVEPDRGAYRYAAVIALRQHRGNRPASRGKRRLTGSWATKRGWAQR